MAKVFELNNMQYKDNLIWGKSNGFSYVYVEVTERCNCSCSYCQIEKPRNIDMDFSLFQDLIHQIKNMKTFEIRLSGGEPLLHDKIIDMVHYAATNGLAVWLCTNGSLLTKKMARDLKKAGLLGVKVSLDSILPRVHNELRGGIGSWESATNALYNAKSCDLMVKINFTMGVQNIAEYDDMLHYGELLGCEISPHFIMPAGRGEKYHLQNDMKHAFAYAQNNIIGGLGGDINCTACSDMIAIDVTGGVRPCVYMESMYNIKEMPLSEIMELDEMRKYLTKVPDAACDNCAYNRIISSDKSCPIISVCRGGCWYFYEKGLTN